MPTIARRERKQVKQRPADIDRTIWLTTDGFARRANCSKTTVQHAINLGHIKSVLHGSWNRINVETELEKMISHLSKRRMVQKFRDGGVDGTNGNGDDSDNDSGGINSANAPLMERVYKAKKAKLDYLAAKKELISAETVSSEWQAIAQGLLAGLLSVPDRVSTMLEGMKHREIHAALTKEIKHACQQLSDSIRPSD